MRRITRKEEFLLLLSTMNPDEIYCTKLAMDAIVSVKPSAVASAWASEVALRMPWMIDCVKGGNQ